jgi:glycosyltransferase involved in cell wall biosynthesis
MRLALLSTYHEVCGIATYSEGLVHELESLDVDVTVLAPTLRPGVTARGEQPRRLWSHHDATKAEALHTFVEVLRARADLVHAQVNHGLYSAGFLGTLGALCTLARIPLIATLHGRQGGAEARRRDVDQLLRALLPAHLLVHNEAHAAELDRGRVHVIPHGIAVTRWQELDEAKRARGLDVRDRVIAHFGFLHPDKGIEEVLHALSEQRNVRYRIVGGSFPTPESQRYLGELRRLVSDLGLDDTTWLPGRFASREEVQAELAAADWVVLNYHTGSSQGTSGAAREALAAGRPLAVSTAPVFDDLREAAHTLSRPITEDIGRMLSDRQLMQSATEKARSYALAHSWKRIAERHRALYERLL